ncbi:MAG: AAA family ATPase [Candidatus Bathyarchaeota archaeon]|nr:AAA family ATPase [Candidatus Bathyarchaeota archaeon]
MSVGNINDRVPSGVGGLDKIIGGGFPRGSLIVLAGNPGTGKTILSACFLYHGAVNYGERGIYVSFAESRKSFFGNMLSLGLDFEVLEREGRFRFLDMLTVREEAVQNVLEAILKEVSEVEAKRLVIDSFSALAQAFRETHEARIILHTILSRITRLLGCTTILITEIPRGENKIGLSAEEFVADGIILLGRTRLEGRLLRELELFKMRGTPVYETQAVFTLKDGFKVFPPFKSKPIEKPCRFQPQPDTEEYFSTGSPDLDKMLEGGYPRGSTVLIEIDEHITKLQYHLITAPTAYNFIVQGRGVILIPSRGVDHNLVKRRAEEGGITRNEVDRLLRICIKDYPGFKPEPCLVAFKGENLKEDYLKYIEVEQKLVESTGQPVLHITGVDTMIDMYGVREVLSALRAYATRVMEAGGLSIILLKPGYPKLAKILGALADVHLKITREHGAVLVYGIKPRTNLHVLEMDVSRGYPMPKLTQII